MSTPRRAKNVLQASERICWCVIERGGFGMTVQEMAQAAGINERTFYRYFATKEDAVRPVLDWGAAQMADRITSRPNQSPATSVMESFEQIVGGALAERTALLFPIVFGDPTLRAVLLTVYHDAEDELRHALAQHSGRDPQSLEVFTGAATIVALTRLAVEVMVLRGDDPLATLQAFFNVCPHPLVGTVGGAPIGPPPASE